MYFAFDRSMVGKSIILENYTSLLLIFAFLDLNFSICQFPLHYAQWTLSCTFHILMSYSKQTGEEITTIIICLPSFSVKEHQVEL